MSKLWSSAPLTERYRQHDTGDLAEVEEPAEWEVDPALLADLDHEMQEQAEDWAALVAQMEAPALGGSCEEGEPW